MQREKSEEASIGGVNGAEEGFEFRVILTSRLRLDAAGNVHGVGAHFFYGLGHILRSQAARKNNRQVDVQLLSWQILLNRHGDPQLPFCRLRISDLQQ